MTGAPTPSPSSPDATRWTVVRDAAAGVPAAREEFARRYAPVVRSYLGARWRGAAAASDVDDAAQEVFVDCFRADGALDRALAARPARFRAFLYGVTRMTARRFERDRAARRLVAADGQSAVLDAAPSPAESLSRVFDRAWAGALLRRAAQRQEALAAGDEPALRRVALLRLRFREGRPVRDIAELWSVDAAWLHHQLATARDEFRRALADVVREEIGPEGVEAECARLVGHF